MKRRFGVLVVFLFVQLYAAASVWAGEVRMSAAASLREALGEITTLYHARHPTDRVLPNFGASGALARQVEQGAPVDLFISANRQWVDYLAERGLITAEAIQLLAGNTLVIIGRQETVLTALGNLTEFNRIAIGSPKSVPAGAYAEQALTAAGIHSQLADRLIMAQDVRQAVVYADRGEVDASLVYKTDALLAQQARILYEISSDLHDEIVYPMVLTVSGAGNPTAVNFLAFLRGPEARQVLERFGFTLP
ncbi:molybdate ABC transporter substrate-binding protein [Geoalkalibacter sp.]|uniref:molybdate ABC transporter substrate-binding protein n=1 Tax=Geoalkalibacter sp. TaxID=3041440 RepID=UPI00272DFABB|nr:molybdate ABC transporter substrate-binding protein [Geoalkalibacter sp.]